jgi:hypothetical protein
MLSIKVTGMAEVVRTLNSIDRDIVKQARRDLKTAAQPIATAVKSNIPSEAPLRGMMHNGRTGWRSSGVKVTIRTNFSKKADINNFQLVSIVVGSKGKKGSSVRGAAAFQIADISGRKSSGNTESGRAMISKLNSIHGASRFVYPAAEKQLPYVEHSVRDTIKKLQRDYNKRNKR